MKENKCLHFLKGISCLLVVLGHYPLPGAIGDAMGYGFRFPVPIFFMISGYFCYFRDLNWIKAQQRKELKLLLCSEAACAAVGFLVCDGSVLEQIQAMRLWSHPVQTILFGTLFNGTLWYLYAGLWTWVFVYLLKKHRMLKWGYLWIPVSLSIHIIGRLVALKYGTIDIWIKYFLSWFLYGAPFVLLGHLLAEKEALIKKYMSDKKCAYFMLAGGIAIVAEYLIWHCFMDIWFSTVLVSLALFLFAILHPEKEIVPAFRKIGKQYSMIIYVAHVPVSRILEFCVKPYLTEKAYSWAKAPLVIMGSLLIAVMIEQIRKRHRQPA